MERGQIGTFDDGPITVFVFEGLIARCLKPRLESGALRFRRFDAALDLWEFDVQVCDFIYALVGHYRTPVEVITWHPHGFAELLHDRLWEVGAPVRDVRSDTYVSASQHIATDPLVSLVYDPDPAHRLGYGFKAREFDLGRV